MTGKERHASYLELDRAFLGVGLSPDLEEHVRGCPRCQAHLRGLEVPASVPEWFLRQKDTQRQRVAPRWSFHRLAWALGISGAAALVLVALAVPGLRPRSRTQQDEGYVGAKGTPAVALFVKRGARVFLWDGEQRLAPGDRLRLKVVPEGFTHLAVFTPAAVGEGRKTRWVPLYSAPVDPQRQLLLPAAWQIDEGPQDEQLVVVLSKRPTPAKAVDRLLRRPGPAGDLWIRRYLIPKDLERR